MLGYRCSLTCEMPLNQRMAAENCDITHTSCLSTPSRGAEGLGPAPTPQPLHLDCLVVPGWSMPYFSCARLFSFICNLK